MTLKIIKYKMFLLFYLPDTLSLKGNQYRLLPGGNLKKNYRYHSSFESAVVHRSKCLVYFNKDVNNKRILLHLYIQ